MVKVTSIVMGAVALAIGLFLLGVVAAYLAWNAFVPPVFQGPHITMVQAAIGVVLLNILRGGFSVRSAG